MRRRGRAPLKGNKRHAIFPPAVNKLGMGRGGGEGHKVVRKVKRTKCWTTPLNEEIGPDTQR